MKLTRIDGGGARRLTTSQLRGRALALLALAALLAAQERAADAAWPPQAGEGARVSDSILGVKVGMSLDEVHAKLKSLGADGGGRGTRDGGRREAWTLKKSVFSSVAYQTDAAGRVRWVTGFVRPGREIPFSELGDPARATRHTEQDASWDVERREWSYRLMARGGGGRARVVQLLYISFPSK